MVHPTTAAYFFFLSQKCDGVRPICSQCRLRPPRSKEPCEYPQLEGQNPPLADGSPSQMLETINALRNRINELEYLADPDPTRIYLNQPYESRSQSHSPDLPDLGYLTLTQTNIPEPSADLIASLIDVSLARFANSGYFFLHASQFRHSAVLPLPFGHRDRPSPALLSAVYLWGTVLSSVTPEPYTADAFLACALQNIPQDLVGIAEHPELVVHTIQAEVLLSLYYLHIACPVQGRYHASVAASIALGANLHSIRSQRYHSAYPPFTLETSLPPPRTPAEESIRIDAFWAAVVVNNLWTGVEGSPSLSVAGQLTPALQGGATITKFLNGNDEHGSSAMAHLAKASILLERIIAFSGRTVGPPDPTSLASLDRRLHTFQAALAPLPGAPTLVLTHALVDLAIVRLHAPYMRTSDSARAKCLAAAARVVVGVGAVSILDGARSSDPMLGPIYAAVAGVYVDEITALRQPGRRSPRAMALSGELETRLGTLMSVMASLAPYSPLVERCFFDMRSAYAATQRGSPRDDLALCWLASSAGRCDDQKFLHGNDEHGSSASAHLATRRMVDGESKYYVATMCVTSVKFQTPSGANQTKPPDSRVNGSAFKWMYGRTAGMSALPVNVMLGLRRRRWTLEQRRSSTGCRTIRIECTHVQVDGSGATTAAACVHRNLTLVTLCSPSDPITGQNYLCQASYE
ncbi:hypothetical protein B0H12DRAFT_1069720 [Mycena haematopus]|nr:hypothetical protein B0H12DRAFT_1069720 [Mycena haematopus]